MLFVAVVCLRRWAVGGGGAGWWAVSVVVVDVDTDSAHRCYRMTLVES